MDEYLSAQNIMLWKIPESYY